MNKKLVLAILVVTVSLGAVGAWAAVQSLRPGVEVTFPTNI